MKFSNLSGNDDSFFINSINLFSFLNLSSNLLFSFYHSDSSFFLVVSPSLHLSISFARKATRSSVRSLTRDDEIARRRETLKKFTSIDANYSMNESRTCIYTGDNNYEVKFVGNLIQSMVM